MISLNKTSKNFLSEEILLGNFFHIREFWRIDASFCPFFQWVWVCWNYTLKKVLKQSVICWSAFKTTINRQSKYVHDDAWFAATIIMILWFITNFHFIFKTKWSPQIIGNTAATVLIILIPDLNLSKLRYLCFWLLYVYSDFVSSTIQYNTTEQKNKNTSKIQDIKKPDRIIYNSFN